jgi:hypothetical protein
MSNETYLIAAYFVVSAICLAISVAAYRWLRRPMQATADSLLRENWGKIIRRGFPLSMVLFVLCACLSVSYYGCEGKEYSDIVKDRSYITAKNAEQISKSLDAVVRSVALWSVILAVALRASRRTK